MTDKQKKILDLANRQGGTLTKREAVLEIGDQYHNADKYVGETLAAMVKSGMLIRANHGVYKIP